MAGDQGTNWHPGNPAAYDDDGNLRDLTDAEVAEHSVKEEAATQVDATRLVEAEGSAETPSDVI